MSSWERFISLGDITRFSSIVDAGDGIVLGGDTDNISVIYKTNYEGERIWYLPLEEYVIYSIAYSWKDARLYATGYRSIHPQLGVTVKTPVLIVVDSDNGQLIDARNFSLNDKIAIPGTTDGPTTEIERSVAWFDSVCVDEFGGVLLTGEMYHSLPPRMSGMWSTRVAKFPIIVYVPYDTSFSFSEVTPSIIYPEVNWDSNSVPLQYRPSSIQATSYGLVVIGVATSFPFEKMWLRKYRKYVDFFTIQEWEYIHNEGYSSLGYAVTKHKNGFCVAGEIQKQEEGKININTWLAKIDLSGNLLWSFDLSKLVESRPDLGPGQGLGKLSSITQTSDGSLIAAGTAPSDIIGSNESMLLVLKIGIREESRLASDGSSNTVESPYLVWKQKLVPLYNVSNPEVVATSDSIYVAGEAVTGYSKEGYFAKLDHDGNIRSP